MQPEHIPIRQFVVQLDHGSGQSAVHAACYYAEFVLNKTNVSQQEIQELLDEARVPEISNLSRDLKVLIDKKYLNPVRTAPRNDPRYVLTNAGADIITTRMREIGLTIARPTERATILKEVSESLHELLKNIPDAHERDFIEEAISCLSPVNNAMRAAVVLGWSGTVHCLRRKVAQQPAGFADFTTYLQKKYPKAKPITKMNDFEDVKDADLLEICDTMDIIKGKSVKKQLQPWLDFRNGAAHPTNVKPLIHNVKAFFEAIVQYVLAIA